MSNVKRSTAEESAGIATNPRLKAPLTIVAIALAIRFVPGWVAPFTMYHFMGLGFGPALGVLGLVIWWLAARRVDRRDKWLGLVAGVGLLVLSFLVADPTMVQVLVTYGMVLAQAGLVAVLFLTRGRPWLKRRRLAALVLAVTLLPWSLLRQDGTLGALSPELSLRWRKTAEDRFLETRAAAPAGGSMALATGSVEAEWPGYRGPRRDGKAQGVTFDPNWGANPPRELWRRRVGPGWSSFAVAGDRIFTQEQRGDEEVVVAYSLADGREIWTRATEERFEEPASGAGPRATPALADGSVYALGANGTLQALDAASGERRWARNLVDDLEAPLPVWGFSSSPLLVGGAVLVFAGADDDRSVVAYDAADGELLWSSGNGTLSYSSVHAAEIGGVMQALMASDFGLQAFDPATGEVLWEYGWPIPQMARIVQPVILDDSGSLVLGTGYGQGSRRLSVTRGSGGDWQVSEVWSSRFLKPYFNGLVCHGGSCYGFDGPIFTAISAEDGERRWKRGRYGHGQVVLVPDMDLLVVMSEQGEIVLLEATPEEHRELARFQALAGKTWNHPVITQGKLLVRNGEEAACYELPG